MATKTKKPTLFQPIPVYMMEYPMCCGIQVASGINLDPAYDSYENKKPLKKDYDYPGGELDYKADLRDWQSNKGMTKEEAYQDFLKEVSDQRSVCHVQLSFVKRRKGSRTGDVPADFQKFLEENGWYTIDEFVNPNHGNLLCVMGKTFRAKKKPKPTLYNAYRW